MKKIISIMYASLLVIGLSMSLSSCNNEVSNEKEELPFLGTWRSDFSTGYQLMTFKANHTGSFAEIDYAAHNYSYTFTWNYIPSNQKIVMIEEDGYIEDYTIINITTTQMILCYADEDTEVWYRIE